MRIVASTLAAIAAACILSRNAAEAFSVVVVSHPTGTCPRARPPLDQLSKTSSSRRWQQPARPFEGAVLALADSESSEEGVPEPLRDDDNNDDDDLDDDSASASALSQGHVSGPLDPMERAWRHTKKPLLRVGAKGATLSHGNSLRQLLQAHTAVKVKVNTQRFDGDLSVAFDRLRALAEESGAPPGIECLQAREKDSVILFGMPGTGEKIASGEFPAPVPSSSEL